MRRYAQGFTLVEIVVIIILISILGAVAAPRLMTQDYDDAFFKDSFIAAMRQAQKIAVATQIDVAAIPVPEDRSIVFLFRDQSTGGFTYPVPSPYALNSSTDFELKVPKSTVFIPPPESIYFDPQGRAHNATTHNVPYGGFEYLINGHTVRVVGETGFVYEHEA